MRVLMLLCLSLLTACSTPVPVAQVIRPPTAPMQPRAMPLWQGETWRDVIGYVVRLQAAFAASEADKAALRAWDRDMAVHAAKENDQ